MADSTKKIISTTRFITATASLTGNTWAANDDVYITTTDLKATNKSADGITAIGASGKVGLVQEAPDLANSSSRLVIRLTGADALNAGLKILLSATEL